VLLKDIYLGTVDAKNEILAGNSEETNRFLVSYVAPPTLDISKFINRKKYYITGLKGTGKTALLRYISLKMEHETGAAISFVLFKSDIDENSKKYFARAATVTVADGDTSSSDSNDYEHVWRWFIYRCLADVLERKKEIAPFCVDENLNDFMEITKVSKMEDDEKFGWLKFMPNIKNGKLEVSYDPKLSFDFDFEKNKEKTYVKFYNLVQRADSIFGKLVPKTDRVNIFFDELELGYVTAKQYKRDSLLIRDLIVTIEKLNSVSIRGKYPITFYAAIRSEVLNSIVAVGKEINKPITDFGSNILWNRSGVDSSQQPLLEIVSQRINASLEAVGQERISSELVWSSYFPEFIQKKKIREYILHNSWYKPRDIVRLLLAVQEQFPNSEKFDINSLESVRKNYSNSSWVEITEELNGKYQNKEIEGIKNLLYGFKPVMSLAEISERYDSIALEHEGVSLLKKNNKSISAIMKDLYRIGVIGNIIYQRTPGVKFRFSFRGDDDVLLDQKFFVHYALRAHLSIS
jgi:hypothetical protein